MSHSTPTAGKTITAYTVYHGGTHYGLGRWSGPHATWHDAEESRLACRQIVGGEPFVSAEVVLVSDVSDATEGEEVTR